MPQDALHDLSRAAVRSNGRVAGTFDLMIPAHARALNAKLATSDRAFANLGIEGLRVVDWAGRGK